ncbi:lariat debranching enzyme [Entomortierella parvispora]|uniref:Lariat debranching enzyme n=1 Tax=Entomortierella parvispora TaxID=205924 RepID=A0A9P3HFA8_9FUNG|nr:lariat debranching enzyme [Entomortierella parvispora]
MRIAIEGCCHGELDAIYGAIAQREQQHGYKVDLLLICGDFQSIRNEADLEAISCPRKYLNLGTFHKYYSGECQVPVPTIFIGGNHEAMNHLWELYHGGWACPGIYFLGYGGVINVGGMRIGGMSGIYKSFDYELGHHEVSPYSDKSKKSAYHIRKFDVYKMLQVKEPVDVFLSHDWPLGIEQYGNTRALISKKRFFEKEIQSNSLGSLAFEHVMVSMKPARWFSAHLHVRFTAEVRWGSPETAQGSGSTANAVSVQTPVAVENPDEIKIDFEDDDGGDGEAGDATIIGKVETLVVTKNPDEIDIAFDDDEDDDETAPAGKDVPGTAGTSAPLPAKNPDEIDVSFEDEDMDEEDRGKSDTTAASTQGVSSSSSSLPGQASSLIQHQASGTSTIEAKSSVKPHPKSTQFLALDKCQPHRQFLEIIDLPEFSGPVEFKYDEEWLSIVRTLDSFLTVGYRQTPPMEGPALEHALKVNREWVRNNVTLKQGLDIPMNFQKTAPAHDPVHTLSSKEKETLLLPFLNPQTEAFCEMLKIPNKINPNGRRV